MDEAKSAPKELTPEQQAEAKRKRRMSYFGIRPGTKGFGTPEAFRDDPKPPVFHFEWMTATDSQEFMDLFYVDYELPRANYAKAAEWLLNRKLLPWDNFTDRDGVKITFASEGAAAERKITPECYAQIPIPLRFDLMKMILNANTADTKEIAGVKS